MMINKLKTTFFAIAAFLTLGVGLSSCNEDSNGTGIPDNICADFVTFVSSNEKGSVFTFQKSGDSELITLTSEATVDTKQLKPGTRVIIQYVPSGGQQPYQSGPITLYAISKVLNSDVESKTLSDIDFTSSEKIRVMTMARSGKYLDLWAEANVANAPEKFALIADEATLGAEYPELYLVFKTDNDFSRTRQIYASFDLASVWDLSTAKGVKVNYRSQSGNETVTFQKDNREPVKPDVNPVE